MIDDKSHLARPKGHWISYTFPQHTAELLEVLFHDEPVEVNHRVERVDEADAFILDLRQAVAVIYIVVELARPGIVPEPSFAPIDTRLIQVNQVNLLRMVD